MEMNIEAIVKQVLAEMQGTAASAPAPAAPAASSGEIPKTAHVAVLTSLEHFEVKEYPMPEVGDDDILVKVEGCGVCGKRCGRRNGSKAAEPACALRCRGWKARGASTGNRPGRMYAG